MLRKNPFFIEVGVASFTGSETWPVSDCAFFYCQSVSDFIPDGVQRVPVLLLALYAAHL